MRAILTGSRYWRDRKIVHRVLVRLVERGLTKVSVGDCPRGVDAIVRQWCEQNAVECEVFAADWALLGNFAGPHRNGRMVDAGGDICIGFTVPGSRGTVDCLNRAVAAGIETWRFDGVWERLN